MRVKKSFRTLIRSGTWNLSGTAVVRWPLEKRASAQRYRSDHSRRAALLDANCAWFAACTLLVIVAAVAGGFVISASEQEALDPAVRAFLARVDAIENEVRSGGAADWAGEYYFGDGLGGNSTLYVAPGAGYASVDSGCTDMGTPQMGSVAVEGDVLVLRRADATSDAPPGRSLRIVRWDHRRYLIDASRMGGFLDAIRFRDEPRRAIHGLFYLRVGDEDAVPLGRPSLRPDEIEQAYAPTRALRIERVELDSCSRPESLRCLPHLRFTVARMPDLPMHEGQAFAVYGPRLNGMRARVRRIDDAAVALDVRVFCTRCIDLHMLTPELWTLQSGPR